MADQAIQKQYVFPEGENTIDDVDANGKKIKVVKLNDGTQAIIRKGKGRDAEDAMAISKGDQKKYMTAMMSRTIFINDVPVITEDLQEMDMDEYLRLQTAFAEINF